MKTLEQVKNDIAIQKGYSDWVQMYRVDPESCIESVDEVAIKFKDIHIDDVFKNILF